MKKDVNFIGGLELDYDQLLPGRYLAGWAIAFVMIFSWGIFERYDLYLSNNAILDMEQQFQDLSEKKLRLQAAIEKDAGGSIKDAINKIKVEVIQKENIVRLLENTSDRQKPTSELLNRLMENYVKGTVIDSFYVKNNQLIEYSGRALKLNAISNIVSAINVINNASIQSSSRIKVTYQESQKKHVNFVITKELKQVEYE